MGMKLLLAIERSEQHDAVLDFTIGLAAASSSTVHVLHVRELATSLRIPPIETKADAHELVAGAIEQLHRAGIDTSGVTISARETEVARTIVDAAVQQECDAIILGSHRFRGLQSLCGHGTRERVLKHSTLPVIVAPPALHVTVRSMADL